MAAVIQGMSGEDFVRAWERGELDPDRDQHVARVSMLIPFGGADAR